MNQRLKRFQNIRKSAFATGGHVSAQGRNEESEVLVRQKATGDVKAEEVKGAAKASPRFQSLKGSKKSKEEEQKAIAEKLIGLLEDSGLTVATKVSPASTFYEAEEYHQDYYNKNGTTPYCHVYTKRFSDQ